jgi:hypothetical protein
MMAVQKQRKEGGQEGEGMKRESRVDFLGAEKHHLLFFFFLPLCAADRVFNAYRRCWRR